MARSGVEFLLVRRVPLASDRGRCPLGPLGVQLDAAEANAVRLGRLGRGLHDEAGLGRLRLHDRRGGRELEDLRHAGSLWIHDRGKHLGQQLVDGLH